jgi:hypothetical protein
MRGLELLSFSIVANLMSNGHADGIEIPTVAGVLLCCCVAWSHTEHLAPVDP